MAETTKVAAIIDTPPHVVHVETDRQTDSETRKTAVGNTFGKCESDR